MVEPTLSSATQGESASIALATDAGKYVYCVIRSDRMREFGAIGIGGGRKVFTVAFRDLAAVVSDTPIERENDEISRLKDEISRHTTTSTYFARMRLEDMSSRYVVDVHEALKPVAVASRSNKPIGDRMILNAAFLVDRAQEQAFDERVKETSRKYEDVLSFKYSGPWPPYNFVNIKLKLEKAD